MKAKWGCIGAVYNSDDWNTFKAHGSRVVDKQTKETFRINALACPVDKPMMIMKYSYSKGDGWKDMETMNGGYTRYCNSEIRMDDFNFELFIDTPIRKLTPTLARCGAPRVTHDGCRF